MQPMRPRFEMEVSFNGDELRRRMGAQLACEGCPCKAVVSDHHVEVKLRPDLRHTWSPQLSIEIQELGLGRARLHGFFAPNPSVWTFFMLCYTTLGFAAMFSAFLGLSQLSMESRPWGFWIMAAMIALMFVPYAASLYGQRLAADQMAMLQCFFEESLGLPHEPVLQPECPEDMRPTTTDTPQSGLA